MWKILMRKTNDFPCTTFLKTLHPLTNHQHCPLSTIHDFLSVPWMCVICRKLLRQLARAPPPTISDAAAGHFYFFAPHDDKYKNLHNISFFIKYICINNEHRINVYINISFYVCPLLYDPKHHSIATRIHSQN